MARWLAITILFGLMAASAAAQTGGPAEEAKLSDVGLMARETLTDNWFGLGEKLAEAGIAVGLNVVQVSQTNARGGLSAGSATGRFSGRYDFDIDVNMSRLVRIPGGRLYGQLRGGWSNGINDTAVGSLFNVNGVAVGDRAGDIWQLYYEQSFDFAEAFIRLGKLDLTAGFTCRELPGSFDGNSFAADEATQFLNAALVHNPTIPFPEPGAGLMLHLEPLPGWYVSAAAADADSDVRNKDINSAFRGSTHVFYAIESGVMPSWDTARGPLAGAYRAGLWYNPQPKDRLNGDGVKRDDRGVYLSLDQLLWRESKDSAKGLSVFARAGLADSELHEVDRFWSVGAQYTGLIPTRDDDVTGLGYAQGRFSRDAGLSGDAESVVELYHAVRVAPWCHVTPNVQYVSNPGGQPGVSDAVCLGLRLSIDF